MNIMLEVFFYLLNLSNSYIATPMLKLADSAVDNKYVFGIDMSIEGLRSQTYSYVIFGFLILSLIFFAYMIYIYWPKGKKANFKTGEKIMFGSLIVGIVLAIIIGWVQLIEGYLL